MEAVMEAVEADLVRVVVLWREDGHLHVLVVRARESHSISHIQVSSTALRCSHLWCDMSRYHRFFASDLSMFLLGSDIKL
jgi:hypothetical protein